VAVAQGDIVVRHCHGLSLLRDLHRNLAVIVVIFYQK
jgi:hypothetical protein